MVNNFSKKVNLEELTQIRLIKQVLLTSSCQASRSCDKLKIYISTTRVFMATELDRMGGYLDRVLHIK